ncbi:hypothetical protein CCP3SC15_1130003 [Gammaproteobacteria bacterium]
MLLHNLSIRVAEPNGYRGGRLK